MLKPTDFPDVQSYLNALLDQAEKKRDLLFEDAFKRGWQKILPIEDFYRAESSSDFEPMAERHLWFNLDDAEEDGAKVAKMYVKKIHTEVAAPDLLKALELCEAWLVKHADAWTATTEISKARSAIQKARGVA